MQENLIENMQENFVIEIIRKHNEVIKNALQKKGLYDIFLEYQKDIFCEKESPFRLEQDYDNVKTLYYKNTKIISYKFCNEIKFSGFPITATCYFEYQFFE